MNRKEKRKQLWATIKHYGVKSVFFRYIISSLIISTIFILIFTLCITAYFYYVRTNDLSKQSTINALQSKNLFESLTSDFHTNYKLACNSETISHFLKETDIDTKTILDTRNFITDLLDTSSLLDEIFIYSFQSNYCISSQESVILHNVNYYEWYRTYRSTAIPFLMFPRKNESGIFDTLYICNEMYSGRQLIGVFCIKINYQKFAELIQNSFVTQPEHILVVSDLGLILYADEPELINTLMFEKEDTYTAFKSAQNVEGNSIIYGDTIIAVAKSELSKLLIMSYIPKESYLRDNPLLPPLFLGMIITSLLLSGFLSLLFSFWQYRSVANVMEMLNNPGKLSTSNGLINEFFYIANSVSEISQQSINIAKKNEDISTELSEKMYLLKTAQIAALQAQINPHFLFNTLQLINLSIIKEIKRDNTATYLVSQLATLVRAAYDTKTYIVLVKEELQITNLYLNIQKTRYKDQLTIEMDIDPECLDIYTVKLILQPLVENSILHGFKEQPAPWKISIRCFKDENYLVYKIHDNGKGFNQKDLAALRNDLSSDRIDRNEKVGVSNVNQRLKLVFGRKCEIHIDSTVNTGSTLTIRHIINPLLATFPDTSFPKNFRLNDTN
ncbi:MAG: histidine kinase [Lachnospiraceae bacterium]|nr:histidine kinase [Lachnospiraceae bacterium]